ncbi:TIM barrel protein [Halorubrum ezzemoulense]|uniref:TIM barrel protein n=1 Tax=Halorubrum ezzemoulense TaxID=337243 RepID=UPI00232C521A|nr:TIM barrel protein [Halorubrum ezzemoulense]MDB2245226.1 TIM barrel protein [Halorubrum ezzemoulense]MDB2290082.1 TIM barrel protein [Halorubrum ezzemoulense]MDB2297552.1 TIM barrel protein [Halorubrum ezzemoulense]MDB2301132.1 TIM barrel protein [Halorubrum ezzemoulense]
MSTHHPPRLWPDDDRPLADARYTFLERYLDALPTLEPTRDNLPPAFDGSLVTATVALENVAPRTSHRSMLRTPEDATAMRDAATTLGHADRLAFTCDVGHARDPAAMLAAMNPVVNVHLHSTVPVGDRAAARIRDRYGIDDIGRLGEFDRPGRAHHLPPHVGELDVPTVLDALDDRDYDGPLTVELAAPYRSADVVHETVDALDIYR